MLYIDLDNFKALNDSRGHKEGDKALKGFADILAGNIRDMDIPARLGGDEFCVLMPDVGKEGAQSLAERIKEEFKVLSARWSWPTTLSIGAFSTVREIDLDGLLKRGDALMYQIKKAGKDSIRFESA